MSEESTVGGTGGTNEEAGAPPPPPPEEPAEEKPEPATTKGEEDSEEAPPPEEPPVRREAPPPSPPRRRRVPLRVVVIGAATALALAISAIVLIVYMTKPKLPTATRAIGARLDLAAGEVTVTEPGQAAQKALSGTPLAIGSHIVTGKGSRALVRTGEGAAVFLRGETEIVLETKGITLERGEAWLDAPRVDGEAIEVKLGKHAVSASDAGLSLLRKGDEVSIYVARGLAILTSPGGRVEINAGEQGTVNGGEAPKIAPVAFWQDWTGGMADARPTHGVGSGSGRIYGVDPFAPPGTPARKLGIAKQAVHAVLRDGIAETEVDQTFSNPGGQSIEGWYWFTVPPEATVSSFALETDGVLVEGEVVEKKEAAAKYAAAVASANDPALLEWVDGRTYRARIFPIPANGTRRVVLRYAEILPTVEGKTRWVYPLRSSDPVRYDEFSLSADLGGLGKDVKVATSLDATLDGAGRVVSMRRSGYAPRADFQIELSGIKPKSPVRAFRFEAGANQADYLMLRWVPDVDFAKLPPPKAEVVVVVDTSAGGDDSTRKLRMAAAEGILRALSDDDRFALVALDVKPTVVYPQEGLAAASEAEIAKALEKLSDHGVSGATDLGSMFEPALKRLHGAEQPAVVYVGDGAATSGETTGEALMDRLRRSLSGSRARFFAVGVGPDAKHELLAELTRAGGGQALRVDDGDQTTGQALRLASAIKTPTITDLELDLGAGLDQPFYSATGKLARGEELMLLARTHHALPPKVRVKGRVGGATFNTEYPLEIEKSVVTALVPRLWASEYVRRLLGGGAGTDENRSKVLDLGLEYGLMTPYTSILALESEAAYARMNVKRRSTKLRGVRLTSFEGPEGEVREKAALASLFPVGPATAVGCSKAASSADEEAPANMKDEKSGGTGARHKGAEGQMGAPAATMAPADPVSQVAASATPATPSPSPVSESANEDKKKLDDTSALKDSDDAPPGDFGKAKPKMAKPGLGAGGGGFGGIKGNAGNGASKPVKGEPPPPPAVALPAKTFKLPPPQPIKPVLAKCSDVASRPLPEKIVLWQKRLKQATQPYELVAQYDLAASSCELPDWRDQAALLDLVQKKIITEDAAQHVLSHFGANKEAQQFVARAILRRTADMRLAAAVSRVLFGAVDWNKLDLQMLDKEKIDDKLVLLRAAMLQAPGDPAGDVRLVRLLAQKGDRQEALAYGRRLRDRGLLTPTLAQQLGDVLVEAGEKDEALRTYSEVVEFDGQNPAARKMLGDVFLRQGWYDAAYRQYKTLVDLESKSPVNWLRLASAAAGAGRVDEALRIERDVSAGEGSPGPDDPRQWARLWSADRLGLLLAEPPAGSGAETGAAMGRKLKELQLFSGPGTLALLTWDDLEAGLVLGAADPTKETLTGERTDSGATGLYAVLSSSDTFGKTAWAARWKSVPPGGRTVKFRLVTLTWDGKAFAVKVTRGELKGTDKQVAL